MRERDIQLPNQFLEKFADMKQEKAKKLHNKYLNVCRQFLFRALPHIEGDILNFPLKQAQDICGDFIYQGKRYYVWQEFFAVQPFFYINRLGRKWTRMVSEVKIYDQKYIELLIDSADSSTLIDIYFNKYDVNERINVPIDYDSLNAYITRTKNLLDNIDNSDKRYHKVLKNYRTAKFFKIITEHFYGMFGEYVLPHIKGNKSHYGRTYYKGINLQNCTKELRIATLGDHTSYDINAAAYAIKLILAKNIYDEYGYDFIGNFTYTKEYLDHKSEIRNELAQVIYRHMPNYSDPLKLVKEAMTAIGFGAKMHEGSWEIEGSIRYNALHYIIYNKNARIAFAKHPFVVEFLKEQDMLGKIIYEYYSRDSNFINKVKDIPDIYCNNGKLNKSKVLAYLYQHMETMIMDMITENIVTKLKIHDSFIVNKDLSSETLKDIKCMLYQLSPYLTLSNEKHHGWISQDVLDRELEHKNFILQEESLSQLTRPELYHKKYTKHIEQVKSHTDYNCYDGYDNGMQYEEYDINTDTMLQTLTGLEKQQHIKIMGYNRYPTFINKLIGNNK